MSTRTSAAHLDSVLVREGTGTMVRSPAPPESRRSRAAGARGRSGLRALVAVLTVLLTFHRRRPWATLLGLLGVGLGLSVLVAVGGLSDALARPYDVPEIALGRPDALVWPEVQQRLAEADLATVRSLPGVAAAAPFVLVPTVMRSEAGEVGVLLIGGDCSAAALADTDVDCTALTRRLEENPGNGYPVVVTERVAAALGASPGDPLSLPGGLEGEAHVAATTDLSTFQGSNDVNVVFTDLLSAQALAGAPGYLTGIATRVSDPGAFAAAAHDALAGRAYAGPASIEPPALLTAARRLLPLIGIVAAVGGVLLVMSTLALTMQDRRRTIATIAALGAPPSVLLGVLALEAILLGFVAAVLVAAPLALVEGHLLVTSVGRSLLTGTGLEPSFALTGGPLLVLIGGGPVLALVALGPFVVQVLKRPAAEGLHGPTAAPGPGVDTRLLAPVGLVILCGATAASFPVGTGRWPMTIGYAAVGAFAAGTALVGLGIPRLLLAIRARVVESHLRAGAVLSRGELERSYLRTGFAVAFLGVAVATVVGVGNLRTFAGDVLTTRIAVAMSTDLWVSGKSPDQLADPRLSKDLLDRIRDLDGVEAVGLRSLAVVGSGLKPVALVGADPRAGFARRQIDEVTPGVDETIAALESGKVALSQMAAAEFGAGVGDEVELPTPRGPMRFPVGAVGTTTVGNEAGLALFVLVDQQLAEQIWGAYPSVAFVHPHPGREAAVASAITSLDSGRLDVSDAAGAAHSIRTALDRLLAPFSLLSAVIVVVALLGVATMLMINVVHNRSTRATLRALGIGPSLEWRLVLYQAAAISAISAVFGVAAGLWFSWLLSINSTAFLAARVPWSASPVWILVGVGAGFAAALLGAVLPTLAARQVGPSDLEPE
ncbi:MAG: FtsX-like permease family protein [Acidimicrobiia bacterium]